MLRLIPDNKRYSVRDVPIGWFNDNVIAKAVFNVNVMDRSLIPPELRH